jgi:hypothetical protein
VYLFEKKGEENIMGNGWNGVGLHWLVGASLALIDVKGDRARHFLLRDRGGGCI